MLIQIIFFKVFLRDNDVYQWVPKSPMRMYYCTLDENVPYENTVVAYNYFKANGATQVDTVNSGALYHTPCAEPSLIRAKTWFDGMKDRKMEITEVRQNASTASSTDGTVHLDIDGGESLFLVSVEQQYDWCRYNWFGSRGIFLYHYRF